MPEDETEIEQPHEHAPTECACPNCQPDEFAGQPATESQPLHMCQRCFSGVCMTVVQQAQQAPAVEPVAEG